MNSRCIFTLYPTFTWKSIQHILSLSFINNLQYYLYIFLFFSLICFLYFPYFFFSNTLSLPSSSLTHFKITCTYFFILLHGHIFPSFFFINKLWNHLNIFFYFPSLIHSSFTLLHQCTLKIGHTYFFIFLLSTISESKNKVN